MKKLNILFVSVFALGMSFVSCSKDDDNDPSIEGKWTATSYSYSTDGGKTFKNELPDNEPGCSKDYIEFAAGNIYNSVSYETTKCVEYKEVGTWSKKDSTLTIKYSDETDTTTIESLTDTTLKIKFTYSETDSTTNLVTTYIEIATFSRL